MFLVASLTALMPVLVARTFLVIFAQLFSCSCFSLSARPFLSFHLRITPFFYAQEKFLVSCIWQKAGAIVIFLLAQY